MKIVCDDKIPFLRGVFEPYAETLYLPGAKISADDVRDADALIVRTRTRCDSSLLEGSRVRVIASATIGYDHIDTAWCEDLGIKWTNAPGCNSGSVAQYIASVLSCLDGTLAGKTLGVVGVGNVGSKVAVLGSAFGMNVLLCDPPRAELEGPEGFVGMDEIIARSDIITLHVPLASDTWHLIDAQVLSRMHSGQVLINSSRGEVVDNTALKAALKERRLKSAILDVWEGEPQIDTELLDLVSIATAHIAGYSADGKAAGTTASVQAVAKELGIVDLSEWTPSGIPAPAEGLEFCLDCKGKTAEEVLREVILHTYDVRRDSNALKAAPERFESLRGDYPVRREPANYTVRLHGASVPLLHAMRDMGLFKSRADGATNSSMDKSGN